MQKLIILVVAVLTPIGLWTAGCRQNRQAAFPDTPEMRSIARSPEQLHPTRPPVIAAAIDREVLASPGPDQPTYDRLKAVMDTTERLAYRNAQPGLELTPGAFPDYPAPYEARADVASYYETVPVVEYRPEPLMAAAPEPAPGHWAPLVPDGQLFQSHPAAPLPDRSWSNVPAPADVSAMMPAAPAPAAALSPDPGIMVPADIPGVFMGVDESDLPEAGWIGRADSPAFPGAAAGSDAPGAISADAFSSVSVDDLNRHFHRDAERPPAAPAGGGVRLDLSELLARGQPSPPPSMPPDLPVQLESLRDLFGDNDIRRALEPLPDISKWEQPAETPARMEAPLPSPAAERRQGTAVRERDLYRMDLSATGAPILPVPLPEADAAARTRTVRTFQHIDSAVEVPPMKY